MAIVVDKPFYYVERTLSPLIRGYYRVYQAKVVATQDGGHYRLKTKYYPKTKMYESKQVAMFEFAFEHPGEDLYEFAPCVTMSKRSDIVVRERKQKSLEDIVSLFREAEP